MSSTPGGPASGLDHSIAKALVRLIQASRRGGDVTQECLAVESAIRRAIDRREAGGTAAPSAAPPVRAPLPDAIGEPIPRRNASPPTGP
ncbi:MAG TPA: hypothetical protein VLH79_13250 [Chthonomonadales bacterium]|nr:hypothetical protein [Chthonomonadales bacterium]